jgi:hypothetical protein
MKDGMNIGRLNECYQREKEWLKETISVEEGKTKLRQHSNYGWFLENYLHMLGN